MKKVRITVLKTMLNEDLAMEYGICRLKAYCGEPCSERALTFGSS